jgi:plasmid maintenance system antidote protein VapI
MAGSGTRTGPPARYSSDTRPAPGGAGLRVGLDTQGDAMPRLTLSTKLVQIKARSGLSYGALAQRMCDHPGHVQRIVTGSDRPKRDTLIRLCLALGLDVTVTDELLRLGNFPGLLTAPAAEAQTLSPLKVI